MLEQALGGQAKKKKRKKELIFTIATFNWLIKK